MEIIETLLLGVSLSMDAFVVSICKGLAMKKLIGVKLENRFESKYESKAAVAGGVVLILICIKILLEHLEIIAF